MTQKTPADVVYENGMTCGTLESRVELNGDAWNGIDWEQDITTDTAVQKATTTAATQFHYANMSHLMLCGTLLKHEVAQPNMDANKLAVCLASHKVEDADIWGTYLSKIGGGATVSRPMKSYYRQLFSEEEALPLFLGMELLGGPIAHSIYTALQDKGDPIFQRAATNMVEQKQIETDLVVNHLQPVINRLPNDKHQSLRDAGTQYHRMSTKFFTAHGDAFDALNVDKAQLNEQIKERVNTFYDRLGLTS